MNGLPITRFTEAPIQSIFGEFDRMFDDFRRNLDVTPAFYSDLPVRSHLARVDVAETPKAIKVSAELPGMEQKNIELALTKDTLTIKGEKKSEHEEKNEQMYRMERSYGAFERVIPLPCEVDEGKVEAIFHNGVLTVTLPKTEAAVHAAKKIAIKTE